MSREPLGNVVFEPSSLASGWASAQVLKPLDCSPMSAYRSANDRQATAVLSVDVSTEMPSMAILSSM